jgi:hypothetical protein
LQGVFFKKFSPIDFKSCKSSQKQEKKMSQRGYFIFTKIDLYAIIEKNRLSGSKPTMKKIVKTATAALALTACLLPTLASCSTYSSSFSNTWYKNSETKRYNDTNETLEYKVTFEKGSNTSYSVEYNDGIYTLELKNEQRDGNSVYSLTSRLEISGKFTVNGESKEFSDEVTSVCYFYNASQAMRPVYSEKTVKSTSPAAQTATTLAEAYTEYDYTVTCDYNEQCTAVTYAYKDNLDSANDKGDTVSLSDTYTTLDNEELFFALRGLSLDDSSTESLYVFNPYTAKQELLTIASGSTGKLATPFSFVNTENGEEAQDYTPDCRAITVTRNATMTGTSIGAYYATNNTETSANDLRHVMLQMISPLSYKLGTLTYTLTKADFTK